MDGDFTSDIIRRLEKDAESCFNFYEWAGKFIELEGDRLKKIAPNGYKDIVKVYEIIDKWIREKWDTK